MIKIKQKRSKSTVMLKKEQEKHFPTILLTDIRIGNGVFTPYTV